MALSHRTRSVGFVIDRWEPARGGAERALTAFAAHLESAGHAVHAFAERVPEPDADLPGRVHRVRPGSAAWPSLLWSRGARTRALGAAGVAAARARGCDVVVGVRHVDGVDVYWPHGGSHARGVAAHARARAWRPEAPRPDVDEAPRGRHRGYVDVERRLFLGESAERRTVVCVSDLVARELRADFPGSPACFVTIENGVDRERFHPRERARRGATTRARLGVGVDDVLLAFVARDVELKGLPVLAAALARLRGAPWVLVVAGARDPAGARASLVRAGLDPRRVRVVGEFDASALYAAADLAVHPTWRDTSGLVILEALASGTPVLTTHAAGAATLVDAESGAVVDPGDDAALAREITRWIDRVRAGVDVERVRARTADHDSNAWLARLEACVLEAAR